MKFTLFFIMTTKLIAFAYFLAVSQARLINFERPHESFRIMGGQDAKPEEFPHAVSLQWGLPILLADRFCGGSIVSDQWILTAAHCIKLYDRYPKIYYSFVYAGENNKKMHDAYEQWMLINSTFIHEQYSGEVGASPYDIGLIKLTNPLKFNKRISSISLPKKDTEPAGAVILSGWGDINNDTKNPEEPNILQKADLVIIDRKSCNQQMIKLAKEEMNIELEEDVISDTQICTGPLTGGIGACSGDSGSALISRGKNGKSEIVGIVSWTVPPCGRKGSPTVYTKVSSFIDWIENIMSKNST